MIESTIELFNFKTGERRPYNEEHPEWIIWSDGFITTREMTPKEIKERYGYEFI